MNLVPTNLDILHGLQELRFPRDGSKWSTLLDKSSLYRLLYSLQIVDALCDTSSSVLKVIFVLLFFFSKTSGVGEILFSPPTFSPTCLV